MICYIILHYQVMEETINCVNHLKNVEGLHQIIIVDNCSPNGSGKQLEKMYSDENNIDVILHQHNDGFARGNNIGCRFAKEKYDPDFYVVMNNDIEISQSDFEDRVLQAYETDKFDVLGPDIYSTTQKIHQSPKSLRRTTIMDAENLKKMYLSRLNSKVVVPLRCFLKSIKPLKQINVYLFKNNGSIDRQKKYYNVPLHGSCVVFSRKFMQCRENCFFDKTFFYFEMEILDYECQINDYKSVYDPSIHVLHHQNISTNATYQKEISKVRFMNEQHYNSISKFLEVYGSEQ